MDLEATTPVLERIFASRMGLYDNAARWFVRGLLFDAGQPPNAYRVQAFPAFPWWAVANSGSGLLAIDQRDPTRQVSLFGTPADFARALNAADAPDGPRPPLLDGQVWLFSNGQSALVTQSRTNRTKGYAHLAGEGLIRIDETGLTWHPPRHIGDPPVPVALLSGPSPWGPDVPWVDWSALERTWPALLRGLGLVESSGVGTDFVAHNPFKDPRL